MNTARLGVIGVLYLTLLATITTAHASPPFQEGDAVQFQFLGDWTTGTVLEVQPNGWYLVRFERRGEEQEWPFTRMSLTTPSASGVPDVPQPGTLVEFDFFDKRYEGEVVSAHGLLLTVQFQFRGKPMSSLVEFDEVVVLRQASDRAIEENDEHLSLQASTADAGFPIHASREESRNLVLTPNVPWQYQSVDARTEAAPGTYAIELGYGATGRQRPGLVEGIVGPSGPALLVSSISGSPRSGGINLQMVRIANGGLARVHHWEGPVNRRLVSTARNGELIAIAEFLGHEPFIEIYDTSGALLTPHIRIEGRSKRPSPRAPWASIVGSTRLLTAFDRELELWDLENGRSVWSVECAPTGVAFVDAARRHVFVPQREGTIIVEIRSGRAVGRIEGTFDARETVAVHPDGTRLAWLDDHSVVMMDLVERAKPAERLGLPGGVPGRTLAWVDAQRVLVDERIIFDVDSMKIAARLEPGPRTSVACAHGAVWMNGAGASIGSDHVLTGRTIETPAESVSNLMVSSPIAVRVATANPDVNERLRQEFTTRLGRMGIQVDDSAEVQLEISATSAGSEQRGTLSTTNRTRQSRTVNKTRWSVAIERRGHTYWSTSGIWDDRSLVLSMHDEPSLDDAGNGQHRSLEDVILAVQVPTCVNDMWPEQIAMVEMPAVGAVSVTRPTVTVGVDTNRE